MRGGKEREWQRKDITARTVTTSTTTLIVIVSSSHEGGLVSGPLVSVQASSLFKLVGVEACLSQSCLHVYCERRVESGEGREKDASEKGERRKEGV